jgi:hypothetical protein
MEQCPSPLHTSDPNSFPFWIKPVSLLGSLEINGSLLSRFACASHGNLLWGLAA